MAWWSIASLACTFLCGPALKVLGPVFKGITRDVDAGMANNRFAIFYSDAPTTLDFTGLEVDTNGVVSNTTALFKFADGQEINGELTGHAAQLPHGIGYGNFTVEGDSGQWITVDLAQGSPEVTQFFQWLVVAMQDGNVTAAEFAQAIDIIQHEG